MGRERGDKIPRNPADRLLERHEKAALRHDRRDQFGLPRHGTEHRGGIEYRMAFYRIAIYPIQKFVNLAARIGIGPGRFVANTDKDRNAQGGERCRRRDHAFGSGKMNAALAAPFGEALHLDQLGRPRLAEETGGPGGITLWSGCVDIDVLGRVVGVHQVLDADRIATVAAAESHCHAVRLRKAEIAMNRPHHVGQDFVGGIAAVHASGNLGSRKAADVVALVIELAIGLLDPRVEGGAPQAAVHFVGGRIGDWANAEKRVGRGPRCARSGQFECPQSLFLHLRDIHRCLPICDRGGIALIMERMFRKEDGICVAQQAECVIRAAAMNDCCNASGRV